MRKGQKRTGKRQAARPVPKWFRDVVRKMAIYVSEGREYCIRADVLVDGKLISIVGNYKPCYTSESKQVDKGIESVANKAVRALWEKACLQCGVIFPGSILTPILGPPINDAKVWT
jgi:aerobic-type carbon monoxide dehydrogenase small subunit (CoxS/CutS family)